MKLFKLDAVRNFVVSKFNKPDLVPDDRKEVADFFSPNYMIDRYQLKKVFFENHYMTSFLVEEDVMLKHILNFNLKFGQNMSLQKLERFSGLFEPADYHIYHNQSFPVNYQELVANHYLNERIQTLVNLKKEAVKVDKERKSYFQSVMVEDFPNNLKKSKILSLDFEYNNNHIYEFGISLCDNEKITNKYYITNLKTGTRDNQFQFNFGESLLLPSFRMVGLLRHYLGQADYLLLHGGYNDISLLNKYNIELNEFPNIKVLDTYYFYPKYFNENSQDNSTLVDLLQRFNIEHTNLHNAGNDARYTLEILLKMNETIENGLTLSSGRKKKLKNSNNT